MPAANSSVESSGAIFSVYATVLGLLLCRRHDFIRVVAVPCQRQCFKAPLPSFLFIHSPSFSTMFPAPWWQWWRINLDVPFRADQSFSYFFSLTRHASLLLAAHCAHTHTHIKLLWPKLRAAQCCTLKHKYLQGNLTACLFSKATIIPST